MAAHSSGSPVVAAVLPDQPQTGWGAWLREIAGTLNGLASWANRPTLAATTFAALPTAPTAGMLAHVSDSTVAAWGGVVAGGGTNKVLVWYNGTAWKVIGA